MEQLIERIAKAPLGAKVGAVAVALVLVTALNYFVFAIPYGDSISDVDKKVKNLARQQTQLNAELTEKKAIANDLNRFRREKEILEQRLEQAKEKLPVDKDLDDLLTQFQDRAQKAGLDILTISPEHEKPEGFYARLPIPMTVKGNFHEIVTFFDALGRLRRIVNVSDITLDSPADVKGKVVVNGKFMLTTFMFLDQGGDAKKKGGAK
jgi:type IV pilus assembly protein PilO